MPDIHSHLSHIMAPRGTYLDVHYEAESLFENEVTTHLKRPPHTALESGDGGQKWMVLWNVQTHQTLLN